jgi:hypothetical protein
LCNEARSPSGATSGYNEMLFSRSERRFATEFESDTMGPITSCLSRNGTRRTCDRITLLRLNGNRHLVHLPLAATVTKISKPAFEPPRWSPVRIHCEFDPRSSECRIHIEKCGYIFILPHLTPVFRIALSDDKWGKRCLTCYSVL